jgi:hypothetical protein
MDWVTPSILLQHKNTGTFGVLGIILNQDCLGNANHYVSHWNTISSQFIIAVARYDDLPLANEFKNLLECFTHKLILTLSINNNQFYVIQDQLMLPWKFFDRCHSFDVFRVAHQVPGKHV